MAVLVFFSRSEESSAHADKGGALFDGGFEVVGHTHRQVRQVVLAGQVGETLEVGAGGFGVLRPGWHGHQAEETQVRAIGDGGDQFGQLLRIGAALGLFFR